MTDNLSPEPTDSQLILARYLSPFMADNPHAQCVVKDGKIVVGEPWGKGGLSIVCEAGDTDFFETLNKIRIDTRFDAIIHKDINVVEFIYAYLDPTDTNVAGYLNRNFTFYYEGDEYKCKFAEPSSILFALAARLNRIPSEEGYDTVPQLDQFHDYLNLEHLPPPFAEYFENKVPRSFFIESKVAVNGDTLPPLARHVNFLCNYYDRKTPVITMRTRSGTLDDVKPRLRYIRKEFPESLSARGIDDVVLTLLEVASSNPPRMAFVYYYQVFEYAGYYFVDLIVRNSLRSILRDPTAINCGEEVVGKLFGLFSDLQQGDDVKMQRAIESCCDPDELWLEVQNDIEFFTKPVEFEGGVIIPELLSANTTIESWRSMWMPKTIQHITRIRNCLVHAREKRESRVIIPTKANNMKIERYLPLVARLAEQVALKHEIYDV